MVIASAKRAEDNTCQPVTLLPFTLWFSSVGGGGGEGAALEARFPKVRLVDFFPPTGVKKTKTLFSKRPKGPCKTRPGSVVSAEAADRFATRMYITPPNHASPLTLSIPPISEKFVSLVCLPTWDEIGWAPLSYCVRHFFFSFFLQCASFLEREESFHP